MTWWLHVQCSLVFRKLDEYRRTQTISLKNATNGTVSIDLDDE